MHVFHCDMMAHNVKELGILLCVNGAINVHLRFPMKPFSNLDVYRCYTVC